MTNFNTKYWTDFVHLKNGGEIVTLLNDNGIERTYTRIGGLFSFKHYGELPETIINSICSLLVGDETLTIFSELNGTNQRIILKPKGEY